MEIAEQDRLIEQFRETVATAASRMAMKRGYDPDEAAAEAVYHLVILFRENWQKYDPEVPGFVVQTTLGYTLNYFRMSRNALSYGRDSKTVRPVAVRDDLQLWELVPDMDYPLVSAYLPLGIRKMRDKSRAAYNALLKAFEGHKHASDLGDGLDRGEAAACAA